MTRSAARTEFLTDILNIAVEGGMMTWADITSYKWDVPADQRHVTLTEIEDDGTVVDGAEPVTVDLERIASAMAKIATGSVEAAAQTIKVAPDYIRRLRLANRENDACEGNLDAIDGDIVLQIAALNGEVIYG